jgi:hypothetical protein
MDNEDLLGDLDERWSRMFPEEVNEIARVGEILNSGRSGAEAREMLGLVAKHLADKNVSPLLAWLLLGALNEERVAPRRPFNEIRGLIVAAYLLALPKN